MKRLLVMSLGLLAACGPRYIWVKDVGQDELNRDRYECERDARMSAGSFGVGLVGQMNAEEFMGRCFQAKGYVLTAVPTAPTTRDIRRQEIGSCLEACAASTTEAWQPCADRCRSGGL
jgi:hypothetical protein